MDNFFRIGVLQKRSKGRDLAGNLKTALEEMERAAKLGADLLLFPECFLTGYEFPVENRDAIRDDGPELNAVRETAERLSIGSVVTAFSEGRERPQNSAYVIGRRGELLMKYSKVHTCDFSDESGLESGTEFRVCDFDGVTLGVMICYDREYPESARMLMLKGAEIILVPNDCGGMKPRLNALCTRAYENMTGVVMANPPGENAGRSCAFSPIAWDSDGNCLDMQLFAADEHSEGIYLAEFDLGALREYRSSEMMGNTFRKVEAYSGLLNPEVRSPFLRNGQK